MRTLRTIFPWLLIAPVLLPVVIWGGTVYPYLLPKTLVFYALSLCTLATFVVLLAHGESFYWSRVRGWSAWIPGLLLALAYLASYVGVGFYHSFWSIFARGDGLLMLTGVVLYFYLLLITADRALWQKLLYGTAVVGSAVALYGIGEWLVSGGRIGSLIGNAAFFAGYLGIALFATLAATTLLRGGFRTAAKVGAALQVLAIILTATRGTLLALGLALVVALGYGAWKGKGSYKQYSAWALATLVVLGGLFVAFRGEIARVPFEPVARIASISTTENDVASRLFVWKHMTGEIAARPLLGVGAEHIDYLFNQFYDPTQIVEQWFDRSHNAFLDYAAQYGVGGLLLYILLIASFFVAARRLYARGEERLAGIVALLAITYAAQNFFVFDTVSSFWLMLALLAATLAITSHEESPSVLETAPWTRYASFGAAFVLVVLIWPVAVRPAIAAYDAAHAYTYALVAPEKSVAYLTNGYALHTYGDLEYGYESYDMYANFQHSALTGDALLAPYQATLTILTANFHKYPYDARTTLNLAHVLSLAPEGVSVDEALLSSAISRAITLSPKRTQPWFILVNLSISNANASPEGSTARRQGYAAAQDLLSKYIALVPKLSEPHYVMAELYLASNNRASSSAEAALGKQYYKRDASTAKRAAQYYEKIQDYENAKYFLEEVSQLTPTDYPLVYDLAKVYYLLGDKAASELVVEGLRKSNPEILKTDQAFLNAITAYEAEQ